MEKKDRGLEKPDSTKSSRQKNGAAPSIWTITDEDVQHGDDGKEKEDYHHPMECKTVACKPCLDLVIVAALPSPK